MLRCDEVRQELSHGEEVSADMRQRIEEHLASCADCRIFAEFVRRLEEQVADLPSAPPPAALADRIKTALARQTGFTEKGKEPRKMAPHILVVDDEPNIVRLMQVNLERHGYRVETASNGAQALEKIRANRPDLLVSDVMMPEVDGFELLANVRRDPTLEDLPVIMLTAKAQDRDIMTGYKTGADMYLTKPFNPSELLQFVKRILSPSGEGETRYNL